MQFDNYPFNVRFLALQFKLNTKCNIWLNQNYYKVNRLSPVGNVSKFCRWTQFMAPFFNIKENKMWNSNMRKPVYQRRFKKKFPNTVISSSSSSPGLLFISKWGRHFFCPIYLIMGVFCQTNCIFKVWRVRVYVAILFHYSFWSQNVILTMRYETYIIITKIFL